MDRKQFLTACCGLVVLDSTASAQADPNETTFVKNWMEDLFASLDTELDEKTKVKVMAGCGRACFRRFSFKSDIAKQGKGSIEKLLAAYKKNFEVWQEGDLVHVRYGPAVKECYCPAARYHPIRPHDIHCECTRATHQTIFETALERPIPVEIVESLRRGGKTCHFVAHIA